MEPGSLSATESVSSEVDGEVAVEAVLNTASRSLSKSSQSGEWRKFRRNEWAVVNP